MVTKAEQLLKLDFYIFPCNNDKIPLTQNGHLDASNDFAQIELWQKAYPNALWGVHVGRSRIVVLDIDKKADVDGFIAIADAWLHVPETYSYSTITGGQHHIFKDDQSRPLNGVSKYRKLLGVDRRAGSSYIVFWGEPPASREVFADPPVWLVDEAHVATGAEFLGQLDDWVAQLEDAEPTDAVIAAIERIPDGDISHSEMIERQMEFIRLGAERHSGVLAGLEILRDSFLNRDPRLHSTPQSDWGYKFDSALYTGITQFGATSNLLSNLPDYQETINKLPREFSMDMVYGQEKPKRHYHDLLEALVRTSLSDEEIVSIMWNSPTVRKFTVGWGEDYLLKQLKEKRLTSPDETDGGPLNLPALEELKEERLSLLTKDEREYLQKTHTWIDLYLDWVRTRLPIVNEQYHIMQALTLLQGALAPIGYFDMEHKTMPLNMYMVALGESSTGKSDSVVLRDKVLHEMYIGDSGYDVGTNLGSNALHANLLERNFQWSLMSDDEIAAFFKTIFDPRAGGWVNTMDTSLTKFYDGFVPPMRRMGNKDLNGKTAITILTSAFLGTPSKVFDLLTTSMFEDGFLARFTWFFGVGYIEDYDTTHVKLTRDNKGVEEYDVEARELALSLIGIYSFINTSGPLDSTREAEDRLGLFITHMRTAIRNHDNKGILTPSIRRLGDSVLKIAGLLALSEGQNRITKLHALQAIQIGEMLFNNVIKASKFVSKSVFQRDLDTVYNWIYSKGGNVRYTAVAKAFAGTFGRDYRLIMETLTQQGLIKTTALKDISYYTIVT